MIYPNNVQALTTKGWVDLDMVTLNHKVAQVDDARTVTFKHPLGVLSKHHKGMMKVVGYVPMAEAQTLPLFNGQGMAGGVFQASLEEETPSLSLLKLSLMRYLTICYPDTGDLRFPTRESADDFEAYAIASGLADYTREEDTFNFNLDHPLVDSVLSGEIREKWLGLPLSYRQELIALYDKHRQNRYAHNLSSSISALKAISSFDTFDPEITKEYWSDEMLYQLVTETGKAIYRGPSALNIFVGVASI